MLMLKLQYFDHVMRGANSLEKILMLGKIEGKRRRGRQWIRWLYSITDSMVVNLRKLRKIAKDRAACCATVHGVAKSQTQLTENNKNYDDYIVQIWLKGEVCEF